MNLHYIPNISILEPLKHYFLECDHLEELQFVNVVL